MTLAQLDLLARGGTIALLGLWSWALLRDYYTTTVARLAVAMNATIICYVLGGLIWIDHPAQISLWMLMVDGLSVMAPAFFWLWADMWFADRSTVGRWRWALVAAFALLPALQIAVRMTTGDFSVTCWLLVRIGMAGFGIAGMWAAWRGRDNDLVEPRRRFRTTLVWAIGGFVLWVNIVEVLVMGERWDAQLRTLTEVAILIVTFAVSAALYSFANPHLFAPGALSEPSASLPDESSPSQPSPLAARLRQHMAHDRPYRAEGLTIAALAAQLGEQEYRLRRLINGELGFRNFTAFLNSHRLAEVRDALADPAQRYVPILTIALDAGFGSLGPFNRAFREAEGMTPSAFRARSMAGDPA
jgi:AraC-like DNA-binding protein